MHIIYMYSFVVTSYTYNLIHFHFVCFVCCCFKSHSRIFHSYGDVTICWWRASNFGLCLALTVYPLNSEGSLMCGHLIWLGTTRFTVVTEGQEKPVASTEARTCDPPVANRTLYRGNKSYNRTLLTQICSLI